MKIHVKHGSFTEPIISHMGLADTGGLGPHRTRATGRGEGGGQAGGHITPSLACHPGHHPLHPPSHRRRPSIQKEHQLRALKANKDSIMADNGGTTECDTYPIIEC